jgi:CubicO group peptidase (beta-lactamase class C family)
MMNLNSRIRELCEQAVVESTFPGCQVAYVREGKRSVIHVGGLRYDHSEPPVTDETIYDVASITKSVVTASLALKLIELGRLNLDDQVSKWIPELSGKYHDKILISHLLTYTVIFDIDGGLSTLAKKHPRELFERMCAADLVAPPGDKYFYTNPPAILLAAVIQRLEARSLEELAQNYFFKPLEMDSTTLQPGTLKLSSIAPSEVAANGEIIGVVQDEAAAAMYADGRLAGNAGLFSTASNLLNFAQMLLGSGSVDTTSIFKPETVTMMHTNQLGLLGTASGLGWEMGRPELLGNATGPNVFLKSGFTGCLMIIDSDRNSALVHLTNRTYPKRPDREPIRAFWRQLNELILLNR